MQQFEQGCVTDRKQIIWIDQSSTVRADSGIAGNISERESVENDKFSF